VTLIAKKKIKVICQAKPTNFLFVIIIYILIINTPIAQSTSYSRSATNSGYEIEANFPTSEVSDISITLTMPEGMIYDADSLDITGSLAYPQVTISSPNDGTKDVIMTMDFGNADNIGNHDFLVKFKSRVANVEDIHSGLTLQPIRAILQYKDENGELQSFYGNMDPVTIIEPDLQIKRSFSITSGWRGDTVDCGLFVTHSLSSTADAYDVDIKESLPQGLSYVPDSMEIVKGPEGTMDYSLGPGWHFPQLDKTWNGNNKIELKYKATIDKQVHEIANMTCLATLDWTSAPGENPEERQYSKTSEDRIILTPKPSDLKMLIGSNVLYVSKLQAKYIKKIDWPMVERFLNQQS
jgi:hypothetical protein